MDYEIAKARMIDLLARRGIRNKRVLKAMEAIPREYFFPEPVTAEQAYGDYPCPIGSGQTISQPYIIAYMLERLDLHPDDKVLEIGTGSGYQTALMACLTSRLYSIERLPELAEKAKNKLRELKMDSVQLRVGDGFSGWPERAPFNAITGSCAPPDVPDALVGQLDEDGRLLFPVGVQRQRLVLIRNTLQGVEREDDLAVRFVPMLPD